ncbi:FG-GAP repeat domain-containing protein [Streptomyces tailanensis]|uniref:FG-GAP repeat domain-containing protein n=1 Tax=Streptomyces tailanensis TaxID=2569858 RepID=UPI00122E28AA|nr:VCBS repeat-containing protein [Streptomyces tailanensis]
MKPRTAFPVLAVCVACAVLAPLSGCGGGGTGREREGDPAPEVSGGLPGVPEESRAPARGKGAKDPDDINGDGYRDFVVSVPGGERIAVLYGSAKGLDPGTRTVHSRRDLGLPDSAEAAGAGSGALAPDTVADLDGDGFPDLVTTVAGGNVVENVAGVEVHSTNTAPYVTWGGPGGPTTGAEATPLRLPRSASRMGLVTVARGDFDGDGRHDLAGVAKNGSSLVVLYGPFTRGGAAARTDTGLPLPEGGIVVDAINPSGEPRATSLLVNEPSDGEQSGNVLYRAQRGTGLSSNGTRLRAGNAHAFGDFDGDGLRDVAVGDDGGRNNEPGYETEPPEVDGSLDVYPGRGGEAIGHRLPEAPEGRGSMYGPGGFLAADPDGDGRDGILVATYAGATLIDGDKRTPVRRTVDKGPAKWRHTRPAGAADFNGDGKDELILDWGAGTMFGTYGEDPTHWWITEGTTSRDQASFAVAELAPSAS